MHLTQIKLIKKVKKVHLLKKVLWKVKLLKKVAQKSYSTKKLFSKGPKKGLLKVDLLKKVLKKAILKKAGKSHEVYIILQNVKLSYSTNFGQIDPVLSKSYKLQVLTPLKVFTSSPHQVPKGP